MYSWIWRHLPGPSAMKALEALVLLVAAIALLFLVVFPWAQRAIPFLDVTVGGTESASTAGITPSVTEASSN
jgi:hypothetical protein